MSTKTPALCKKLQGSGAALLVSFAERVVRVQGDGNLKLEDAVKQAIMREFGQARAWADAHVNVGQLLARNLATDMGSQNMFSKTMDAKGMQLFASEMFRLVIFSKEMDMGRFNTFASEMFGREGHEGYDARPNNQKQNCPFRFIY